MRWLRRLLRIPSPSRDAADAGKQVMASLSLYYRNLGLEREPLICNPCWRGPGKPHVCEVPSLCECKETQRNCPSSFRPVRITYVSRHPLPQLPIVIGRCCREWPLALGFRGRCGLCGETPTFVRHDTSPVDLDHELPVYMDRHDWIRLDGKHMIRALPGMLHERRDSPGLLAHWCDVQRRWSSGYLAREHRIMQREPITLQWPVQLRCCGDAGYLTFGTWESTVEPERITVQTGAPV